MTKVFWEMHYLAGGSSGRGSEGDLAVFKAFIVNQIVRREHVTNVVEFGCGDGQQLELIDYPSYVGVDIAPRAVQICKQRFAEDPTKTFMEWRSVPLDPFDMAVSLDVVYHLLEDDVFEEYMHDLFTAERLVLIYSSNLDAPTTEWGEVRHRRFTDWIECKAKDWVEIDWVPQMFPEQSWSDFFLYGRR